MKKRFLWLLIPAIVVVGIALLWFGLPKPPILVGFLGTMSGRLSDLGISNRRGVELAIAEINSQGGIHGRQIQLVSRDDANDTQQVREQFEELVSQNVVAILGPVTSTMANEVIPLANQRKVLVIGTTVSSNEFSGRDDFFLRVSSPNRKIVEELAGLLVKRGVQKVGVIADHSNPTFSVDWLSQFSEYFSDLGGTIACSSFFFSGDIPSLENAVDEVMSQRPSTVLVLAGAIDAAQVCQEIRCESDAVLLVGTGWAFKPEFLEYGGKTVEGFLINGNLDPGYSSERYLRVSNVFLQRYGKAFDFGSKAGYDAAYILFWGMEKAREFSAASLKKEILEQKVFEGVQQVITLDSFGDPDFPPMFFQVQGGKFVRVESREQQ
ncbi:MAG TPA: ABC transporter substrate-binding protein [Thermotogota bacterium]|nr:ABC transporter substrate-binding protein [Thermotogota bacterium]